MKAVWRQCPITVKEVQADIYASRPLAYTTVMTILHRLYLKGFLRRTLHLRTHYYEPAVAFTDVREAAVAGLIDHFFPGSKNGLVEFLGNGSADSSPNSSALESELHGPIAMDETLL